MFTNFLGAQFEVELVSWCGLALAVFQLGGRVRSAALHRWREATPNLGDSDPMIARI